MPVISRFFGIIVRMFYEDHEPAHFHAEYQGEQAKFSLSGELLVGRITSRTARRLIKDWGFASPGGASRQLGTHEGRRDDGADPSA